MKTIVPDTGNPAFSFGRKSRVGTKRNDFEVENI